MVQELPQYRRKSWMFGNTVLTLFILSIGLIIIGILFSIQLKNWFWSLLSILGILGVWNSHRLWKASK